LKADKDELNGSWLIGRINAEWMDSGILGLGIG